MPPLGMMPGQKIISTVVSYRKDANGNPEEVTTITLERVRPLDTSAIDKQIQNLQLQKEAQETAIAKIGV